MDEQDESRKTRKPTCISLAFYSRVIATFGRAQAAATQVNNGEESKDGED